jgi:hypothetical protein
MITVDVDVFEGHDTETKRTAGDLVDAFYKERGSGLTFREIGDKHGVSHERVRQVLENAKATYDTYQAELDGTYQVEVDGEMVNGKKLTIQQIAVKHNTTADQVRHVLDNERITYERNWASTVRKEKLASEVNEWLTSVGPQTAADICDHFELSSQRLMDLVSEHGVPRRYVMAGAGRTGSMYTDDEITHVLASAWKRLKAEIPTATGLSVSSYDRVRLADDPSPALITSRKPWKVLCDAAGVPCGTGRGDYKKKWSDQDLLDWIDRYADDTPTRVTFDGYDEWRTGLRKKSADAEPVRWKDPEEGAPSGALLRTRLRRAGYATWLSMVAAATKPAGDTA